MTPSGVPPMPKRMSVPLSGRGDGDGGGDVAVLDELDAGARLAALADDVLVAGTVEDDRGDVVDVLAERLGHRFEVGLHRRVDVDHVGRRRTHRDLVHVDARAGVEHRAPLGDRDHRDRVVATERRERGAVDRVDRDVARGPAGADLLAVEQHRRFVLLALADDDDALHRHRVEDDAHGVDRGTVGAVLVALAQPAPGGQRRGLGDADELHRQVAVGGLGLRFHRELPGGAVPVQTRRGWTHRLLDGRPRRGRFHARRRGPRAARGGPSRPRRIGPLLEIGTYCGKSAIYLGAAAREAGSVLFTVDHHRGSEENQAGWEHHDERLVDPRTGRMDTLPFFRRTIEDAGLEDVVVAVIGASPTVAAHWATPLGLVFVDGGHAFDVALADYEGWSRHLAPGGSSCSTTCSRTRPTAARRRSRCGSAPSPTASRPSSTTGSLRVLAPTR